MDKICEICEYYYKEHCCNSESIFCTEYVSKDDTCDDWEVFNIVNSLGAAVSIKGMSFDEIAKWFKDGVEY